MSEEVHSAETPRELVQCQITGRLVPADEAVTIQGYRVSAEGKQLLLEQLRAGEPVVTDAAMLTDPGWRTTRNGVNVMFWATVVMIAAIALMVVLMAVAGVAALEGGGPEAGVGALIAVLLPMLVGLGAAIAVLVGQCMCCAVPADSGARGLIIGAVVCAVTNILLSVVGRITGVEAIGSVGSLVGMVGYVLLLLFFWKLGRAIGERELSRSAMHLLIFAACVFGAAIVMIVVMVLAALASGGGDAGAVAAGGAVILLGLLMIAGAIVMVVWWLRLLWRTRLALDARLA